MSLVERVAQWASGRPHPGVSVTSLPSATDDRLEPSARRRTRRPALVAALSVLAVLASALPLSLALPVTSASAAGDYLLMPRAELLRLPTSGTAWSDLKSVADSSLGSPNLCDINSSHHVRTLAAALVYARTGSAGYGTKARAGVMAGIKSLTVGCDQAVLSLGRQLMAYVLAADFAGLSGTADATFRAWLTNIRTKYVGGHTVWNTLARTHADSANNWGAYAGASRIAASLYLGDTHDVAIAARITRGFLGDRSAYAGFGYNLDGTDLSWSCKGSSTYTPVNTTCSKSGINVDGAVIADISRGGGLKWPPASTGISYQLEAIQGLGLQVELLSRHGYTDAWHWSNSALRRMADVVTRSKASGGVGWNATETSRQMPWLLDARYGLSIPRDRTRMGRAIGFTAWLYGKGSTPTPAPTPQPPTVGVTWFGPSTTSTVPLSGIPVKVAWHRVSSSSSIARYDLQWQHDGGSWTSVSLGSATATSKWLYLGSGQWSARVRAVDSAGRVGDWVTTARRTFSRVDETSSRYGWQGSWSKTTGSTHLGGTSHSTPYANAATSVTFSGSYVAWVTTVGPAHGKARVYVDGSYVRTVDTYAKRTLQRKTVFATHLSSGSHRLTVKTVGTSGRPYVTIDAVFVANG